MRKWFAPTLIAAAVLFSMFVYPRLPERMPVHWGLHGQVDRYGSRVEGAFMLPAPEPFPGNGPCRRLRHR